jgi:phosphohistidine swiveling domain-containing protein
MRRANNDFVGFLKTYLFTERPILKEEHGATRRAAMAAAAANVPRSAGFRSAHLKDGEQVT